MCRRRLPPISLYPAIRDLDTCLFLLQHHARVGGWRHHLSVV